jgi:hypothetical protein
LNLRQPQTANVAKILGLTKLFSGLRWIPYTNFI